MRDVVPLIFDPPLTQEQGESALAAEFVQIAEIDSEPIDLETARAVIHTPGELAPLLSARNRLYLFACEQGRVGVKCPTCGAKTELDLLFYALTLGVSQWELTDRGVLLRSPYLGVRRADEPLPSPPARPAGIRATSQFDFALPSARLGVTDKNDAIGGVLGDLDPSAESAAWARWVPLDKEQPVERIYWDREHAGFRTMLRLSVALEQLYRLGGGMIEPTPVAVEQLFLADFHFLDLLCRFTHDLPVSTESILKNCSIACAECGKQFLAVR